MFSKIWAGIAWGVLLKRFFKARGRLEYGNLWNLEGEWITRGVRLYLTFDRYFLFYIINEQTIIQLIHSNPRRWYTMSTIKGTY